MSLDADWRAESATLLDNLTAARQAAADASDDVDRRLHLSFAHDAAACIANSGEVPLRFGANIEQALVAR